MLAPGSMDSANSGWSSWAINPVNQQIAFFPPKENMLPDNQAIDDLWSRLTYAASVTAVAAEFMATAAVHNQQTDAFKTSVDRATFVKGATAYFDAVSSTLAASAPDFHRNRFVPFFNQHIRPKLT